MQKSSNQDRHHVIRPESNAFLMSNQQWSRQIWRTSLLHTSMALIDLLSIRLRPGVSPGGSGATSVDGFHLSVGGSASLGLQPTGSVTRSRHRSTKQQSTQLARISLLHGACVTSARPSVSRAAGVGTFQSVRGSPFEGRTHHSRDFARHGPTPRLLGKVLMCVAITHTLQPSPICFVFVVHHRLGRWMAPAIYFLSRPSCDSGFITRRPENRPTRPRRPTRCSRDARGRSSSPWCGRRSRHRAVHCAPDERLCTRRRGSV